MNFVQEAWKRGTRAEGLGARIEGLGDRVVHGSRARPMGSGGWVQGLGARITKVRNALNEIDATKPGSVGKNVPLQIGLLGFE